MSKGKLAVGVAGAVVGAHHGVRRLLAGLVVLALVAALGVAGIAYLAAHVPKSSHGSALPCGPVSVLFGDTTTPPTVEAAVAQALAVTGRKATTGTVGADLTIYWSESGTGLVTVIPGGVVNADSAAPNALAQLTADLRSPTVAPSCAAQAPPSGPSAAGKTSGQQSPASAPTTLIALLAALVGWWAAGPWVVRKVARLLRRGNENGGDEKMEPDEDQGADEPVRWPESDEFNEQEEMR